MTEVGKATLLTRTLADGTLGYNIPRGPALTDLVSKGLEAAGYHADELVTFVVTVDGEHVVLASRRGSQ